MVEVTYSSSATVNTIKTWRHLPVAWVQLLDPVWVGLTLITEAVQCEVVSTHKQTYMNRSWHIVIINETQPLSLLFFCSWDRI